MDVSPTPGVAALAVAAPVRAAATLRQRAGQLPPQRSGVVGFSFSASELTFGPAWTG